MKIGIVTFQRAQNFGACIQMFALKTYLIEKGYDVYIMDYNCHFLDDSYNPSNIYFSKRIYSGLYHFIKDFKAIVKRLPWKKYSLYQDFLNENFKLTNSFSKAEDMPMDFDILITGSDQVWNYAITNGRDEVFFLDNKRVTVNSVRRISYAASVEMDNFYRLVNDKEYVVKALKNFDWVSVRERKLTELLRTVFCIDADTVLDPTFLIERDAYLSISIKPKFDHYLLVYEVSKSEALIKVARIIAKDRNLKIIYTHSTPVATDDAGAYGPLEMLGLICYADVVVTSSFHGTALSIINRKEFYAVYDKPSSRIEDLLSLFDLSDRLVIGNNPVIFIHPAVYDENAIYRPICQSKEMLDKAILGNNM